MLQNEACEVSRGGKQQGLRYKYYVDILESIFPSIITLLEYSFVWQQFTFTPCTWTHVAVLSTPSIGKKLFLLCLKYNIVL